MKIKLMLLFTLLGLSIACKKEHSHSHKITTKPIVVLPDGGKEWNVFGVKIIGKILSEDTQGAYSVIVTDTPPMGGPPPHIHSNEDELFYVLKGHYEFYCGNQTIDAPQGSLIQLPKGIAHHFKNIDTITGVTINTITPGGFENFFETIAQISKKGKPSRQQIDSIANSFGMKFMN